MQELRSLEITNLRPYIFDKFKTNNLKDINIKTWYSLIKMI
jgi:hypothetical protein